MDWYHSPQGSYLFHQHHLPHRAEVASSQSIQIHSGRNPGPGGVATIPLQFIVTGLLVLVDQLTDSLPPKDCPPTGVRPKTWCGRRRCPPGAAVLLLSGGIASS